MTKDLSNRLEPVVQHSCLLGEGPVWDAKNNCICWLDIINGHIHQYYSTTNRHTSLDVQQMIGCIALTSGGNFIAGVKNGIGFVDRQTGIVDIIAEPEKRLPGNRFNDGKCDPAGRFWAGTMALSEEKDAGSLYMVDLNRTVQKKKAVVTISNGLAWNLDGTKMYYIDTPTYTITTFDFDVQTGSISNESVAINIPEEEGAPDGMTIDSEGKLWVAHWGGWQVSRWDPLSGKKISSISLPVEKVTSCIFGGKHLRDLYITTAKIDLSQDALKRQPLAGSLFVIEDCGFQGVPAVEFPM